MSTNPGKAKASELVIDPDIRDCVADPMPREAKHDAKSEGERQGCDAAAIQRSNLLQLIELHGVGRPIFVWDRAGELVIVDGIKTYLAALELGKLVDIKVLAFANVEEAKAFRWYVNVAAARRPSEDAAVWTFLEQYDWLVAKWRAEGRVNQGKQSLCPNSEKVNWRTRAAQMCQTTKSRVEAVYALRREAERVARISDAERENLAPEEVATIKLVDDGVKSMLSGARSASSVVSNIKGRQSRRRKSNKGKANEVSTSKKQTTLSTPESDYQVVQADSLQYIAQLPVGSFKYLLGSPPYFSASINYGIPIPWLESWEKYEEAMTTYFTHAYRIIPPGGGIIINVDDTRDHETKHYFYHTELITRICLKLGMYDAGRICWSKQNVSGKKHAKGSNKKSITRPNHEYVLAFFKGQPEVDIPSFVYGEANHLTLSTWIAATDVEEINAEHWAMFSNFWEIAPSSHPDHPAIFPATLVYRMLTRFTGAGDVVCDPWTGTGSTGVQCVATGRRFLGIEMGSGFAGIALKNIEKAKAATKELSVERLQRIERYLKSKFVTEPGAEGGEETPASNLGP